MTGRPALLLDRDGTLIVDAGYPRDPDLVVALPGAIDALRGLADRYALVIVSNQSGVGRGRITPAEARAVHDRVIAVFAAGGVAFTGAYYCPHAPEAGCRCRKPAPGLVLDAARDLGLDLARSVMIGDKPSDLACGRAAGCGRVIALAPAAGEPGDPGDAAKCTDWAAVGRALATAQDGGRVASPSEPR
jgi:D-glycero-D-manno-heptose 1,7-bisphosphate phosphatase